MPGPLRTAIQDAVYQNFEPQGGPGWWSRVKARWTEFGEVVKDAREVDATATAVILTIPWLAQIGYALTGTENVITPLREVISGKRNSDISSQVAEALRKVFSQPAAREIAETLGAAVTEPVLSLFEQYAGRDDKDPKEFARAFHGFMIGLNTSGGLADTILETTTGGQVEGVGRLLQSMYWSLGLGFLGWQTLAPLLESGLQPGLDRYYKRLYRPQRFAANDLRDLFALGKLSEGQMKTEAANIGWRDQDIDQWIDLAYRTLAQGDIWAAWHQGFISQDEATRRLRALGYNPDDIPLLFKLNPKEETQTAREFSAATARKGYREGLISQTDLREILTDLRYPAGEIDLIIKLEDLAAADARRTLTVGQVKAAWTDNVITDPEARHWLGTLGLGTQEVDILLKTWALEIEPPFRKLNLGTITGAYVAGILTREAASTKLQSVGLSQEDALLELTLAERRNPEAFGNPAPPPARLLTPGALADLVAVGLITPAQMSARLLEIGYTETDANLLSEAARIRANPEARPVPQRSVERAYLAGVLDRSGAFDRLTALGFDMPGANLILDTLEAENPEAFDGTPETRQRYLSPTVLEDLFIAGIITREEMGARLIALGYSEADTNLFLARADLLMTPPVRVLNQASIERAYLVGVLDRTGATGKLLALDFTPEDAARILDTVERENPQVFNPDLTQSTRQPSIGALVAAVRNGIITEDEYFARATEIGFRPDDAAIYLAIATREERKSSRVLGVSQVGEAYRKGFMPRGVALVRVSQLGYSDEDANLILRMEKDFIENTDIWNDMLSGALDPFDAIGQLVNANYNDKDIVDAFGSLPAATLATMGVSLSQLSEALGQIPGGQ